jgi:uncharacterized protein (TIGR03067 family)
MTRFTPVVFVFAALVVGCSSKPTESADDLIKKDREAAKGDWKVVAREIDGVKATEEELKDLVAHRDGEGKLTTKRGDTVLFEAVSKIDPTKSPKTFESTQISPGPNKDKVSLGIYKLEGDTMTICAAPPGAERPTEFSSKSGSKWSLVVTRRIKP